MKTKFNYLLCLIGIVIIGFFMACEKKMPYHPLPENPLVTIHYLPESIDKSDTKNVLFMVKVKDGQGLESIKQVTISILQQNQIIDSGTMWNDGQNGDIIAGNGIFTYAIVPAQLSFFIGEIVVNFLAEDLDGNKSPELKDTLTVEESVPNEPPKVNEVDGPATISRSQGGIHLLTAAVSDPQGLSDIQKVFFNSFLPDGSPSTNNPFSMYDTGANGDATAGDGIYSFQFTIGSSNALGTYRFEVQAQDKSGAKSSVVVHTISVVQ